MTRYRPVAVALLCVLALSLAAATLTDPVSTGGGPGVGSGGAGAGDVNETGLPLGGDGGQFGVGGPPGSLAIPDVCLRFLQSTWVVGGALLLFVAAVVLLARRFGAFVATFALAPFLLVGVLVYAFLTNCGPTPTDPESGGVFNFSAVNVSAGGGGGLGEGAASAATVPSVLLLVAGIALLGLAAVLLRATGDDTGEPGDEPEPEADDGPADPDLEAVGAAAGEAADRIEAAADVENEVYRAWREMTDYLDVARPASTTPAEFAAAARDAGMADDDVDELTALFREVRYGGADADADREERAVRALRNVEAAYGESENAGADTDADTDTDIDTNADTDGSTDGGGRRW